MRKVVAGVILALVFATGVFFGLGTPKANAGTRCWTTCNNGVGMECCRIGPIVECRVLAGGC